MPCRKGQDRAVFPAVSHRIQSVVDPYESSVAGQHEVASKALWRTGTWKLRMATVRLCSQACDARPLAELKWLYEVGTFAAGPFS